MYECTSLVIRISKLHEKKKQKKISKTDIRAFTTFITLKNRYPLNYLKF